MTTLELVVCIIQQAEREEVRIEVDPLRATGPAKAYRDFTEVVKFLRDLCEQDGEPGLVDRLFRATRVRGPKWYSLGGIDWGNLDRDRWALSCHEQELLLSLGSKVRIRTSEPISGRLEAVTPGRCFVTPEPYTEPVGSAVCRFVQRTERALPYWSDLVEVSAA